jgi:hypothetical protein
MSQQDTICQRTDGSQQQCGDSAQAGSLSRRDSAIGAALKDTPKQTLVMIWPVENFSATAGLGEMLPRALQTLFTSTYPYCRTRIIGLPEIYCCSGSQWWEKTRLALGVADALFRNVAQEALPISTKSKSRWPRH